MDCHRPATDNPTAGAPTPVPDPASVPVPAPAPRTDPLATLREQLGDLRLRRDMPSTRTIARMLGAGPTAISHNTVNLVLRCERAPRWPNLRAVVQVLDGDVEAFRRLWSAANQHTAQTGAHPGPPSGRPGRDTGVGPVPVVPIASTCDPTGARHLYCGRPDGGLVELWFRPEPAEHPIPVPTTEPIVAVSGRCVGRNEQWVAWVDAVGQLGATRFGPSTVPATFPVGQFGGRVTGLCSELDARGYLHIYLSSGDGTVQAATRDPGDGRWHTSTLGRFGSPVLAIASQIDAIGVRRVYFGTRDGLLREARLRSNGAKIRVRAVAPVAVTALACGLDHTGTQYLYWGDQAGNLHQTWLKRDEVGTWRAGRLHSPITALAGRCDPDQVHRVYSATEDGRIHRTWFGPGTPGVDTEVIASSNSSVTGMSSCWNGTDPWQVYWANADGEVFETGSGAGVPSSLLRYRTPGRPESS